MKMFELLTLIVFVGLFWSALKFFFKVAWGLAKVIAVILMVLALPVLIVAVLAVGGAMLLLPVALIGAAVAILSACLE